MRSFESPASSDDGADEAAAAGFSPDDAAEAAPGVPEGPAGRIDGALEAPGAPGWDGRMDGGAPGAPGMLDAPGAPALGAPGAPGAPGGGRGRKPASMGRCGVTPGALPGVLPGAPPGGGRGAPGAPGAVACVLGDAVPGCGGRPGMTLAAPDGGAPLGGMGRPGGAVPGALVNGLLPGAPVGASGRAVCRKGLPTPGRMYGGAPGRDCGGRTVMMVPAAWEPEGAPDPGLVGVPSGGRAGAVLDDDACGPVCCGRSAGAPGALLLGACVPKGMPGGRARGSGRTAVSAVLDEGASDADAFSARLLVDGRTWPSGGRVPLPMPAALDVGALGGRPGWAPAPEA